MSIDIISASAGAGKTYTLAAEMEQAIASGAARPDAVVAITYTNKAAAELSRRLRRRLLGAGLGLQAACIRDGYLGTVHSVCQRLIAELAFESGTSPYPKPAPETYSNQLFRAVTGAVSGDSMAQFARELEALSLDADDTRGAFGFGHANWRDHLKSMVDLVRLNRLDDCAMHQSAAISKTSLLKLLGPDVGSAADRDEHLFAGVGSIRAWVDAEKQAQLTKKGTLTAVLKKQDTWLRDAEQALHRGRKPSWSHLAGLSRVFSSKKAQQATDVLATPFSQHLTHPRLHQELALTIDSVTAHAFKVSQAFTERKQAERLIDFSDMLAQAARVLRLPEAQERLSGRLDLVMVDEFQDTSPVQLEVVMALASIAKRTVWVGDRKQAIFGFQGADPALMESVGNAVLQGRTPRVLGQSFRSRPPLVSFCSHLFTEALAPSGFSKEEVVLEPACPEPASLQDTAALHLWNTTKRADDPKEKIQEGHGIGRHIATLLKNAKLLVREELSDPTIEAATRPARAGDIAVLARTNLHCRAIAAGLERFGIRARVADTGLGSTPEALLVRAGLAILADPDDHMAAAEIARFTDGIQDPDSWLADRIRTYRDVRENGGRDMAFADLPALQRLRSAAVRSSQWSPEESMLEVFAALDLHERALSWPDPRQNLANLEVLRAAAQDYQATCEARRSSATVAGLVQHLDALPDETSQALPVVEDAVRVLTYHRAKGLEWPIVVCAQLDKTFDNSVFDVRVEPAANFDPNQPLKGRQIRWWPWPYGRKSKGLELADRAQGTAAAQQLRLRENSERVRLLYVAFTRARDHLVLSRMAGGANTTSWLDCLQNAEGGPILDLPWQATGNTHIDMGAQGYPCTVAHQRGTVPEEEHELNEQAAWFVTPDTHTERAPQRISPSAEELSDARAATVNLVEVISLGARHPLSVRSDQMAAVGEAIHGFLAADLGANSTERESLAQRLLHSWGLRGQLAPSTIISMADRFTHWLDQHAPGARLPEWPVRWLRDDGRAMSGDIDLLVPTDTGWLLFDHKSFPGDTAQRNTKLVKWSGQLDAYRSAIEAATGQPVSELWIHLPVRGEVVRVEVARAVGPGMLAV